MDKLTPELADKLTPEKLAEIEARYAKEDARFWEKTPGSVQKPRTHQDLGLVLAALREAQRLHYRHVRGVLDGSDPNIAQRVQHAVALAKADADARVLAVQHERAGALRQARVEVERLRPIVAAVAALDLVTDVSTCSGPMAQCLGCEATADEGHADEIEHGADCLSKRAKAALVSGPTG